VGVQFATSALQQGFIGGVLDQRVLENVDGIGWRPAPDDEARCGKPRQGFLERRLLERDDGGEEFV